MTEKYIEPPAVTELVVALQRYREARRAWAIAITSLARDLQVEDLRSELESGNDRRLLRVARGVAEGGLLPDELAEARLRAELYLEESERLFDAVEEIREHLG